MSHPSAPRRPRTLGRSRSLHLFVQVALTLVVLGACGRSPEPAAGPPGAARVVEVVDGDTLVVRLAGSRAEERVRLIGIDTPESVDPRSPVECYGPEAGDRLRSLLPVGTTVRLERDVEARDRYDRLLAYVHRADDDLFVNRVLVEEGYAEAAEYPPNVTRSGELAAAASAARASATGLWGACPRDR